MGSLKVKLIKDLDATSHYFLIGVNTHFAHFHRVKGSHKQSKDNVSSMFHHLLCWFCLTENISQTQNQTDSICVLFAVGIGIFNQKINDATR